MTRDIPSFWLIVVLMVVCAACSNKYHASKIEPTDHVLVGKPWKEVNIEVFQNDSLQKNITKQFMKSDLDDVIIFNPDGTYFFDEGISKARTASAQIYQRGLWQINESKQLTFIELNGDSTTYSIEEMSPEKLIIKLPAKKTDLFYVMTYVPLR